MSSLRKWTKKKRRYPFDVVGVNSSHLKLDGTGPDPSFVRSALETGFNIDELSISGRVSSEPASTNALVSLLCSQSLRGRIRYLNLADCVPATWIRAARALSRESTIETLRIELMTEEGSIAERHDAWRWLAHVLFSDTSQSSITTLVIVSKRMTHGDITAMEDVFNGQWHPSDSTSRPAVVDFTDESSRYVRAVGNAVVRVCGAIFSLSSIRLSSLDELILVDEDTGTEWMEVRTPRIGHFFVRCDDIIDAGEVTNQEPNSVSSRLRSLSLSFEEFEPGTVSAFIRLVGRTLTTLSIPCKLALLIAVKVKSSVSRIFKRQRQHPEAYFRALDKASVRRIFSYCEREVVRLVSITEIVLPSTTVAHC